MAELILKLGNEVIRRVAVERDTVTIGRSRDNDLVVENLSTSRNHARVRRHGDKFVLTDLGSSNGTFVNGVNVTKTEIVDGDVVTVGKHTILFRNPPDHADLHTVELSAMGEATATAPAPTAVLAIRSGKLDGKDFILVKEETILGKNAACDIVLTDDLFLGKQQACIRKTGEGYEIRDIGGLHKTKVNGMALKGTHKLRSNDSVEIGSVKCVFQLRVPEIKVPKPPKPAKHKGGDSKPAPQDSVGQMFAGIAAEVLGAVVREEDEPPASPAPDAKHAMESFDDLEMVAAMDNDGAPSAEKAPFSISMKDLGGEAPPPAGDHDDHPAPAMDAGQIADHEMPSDPHAPVPQNPELLEKEVAIWEKALGNKSPIIRKQAAARLKKLTGKDYAY